MSFSRAHYRRVSPPADTVADLAARQRHLRALELARADVAAQYPDGINAENADAVLAYQEARIEARTRKKGGL